MGIKSSRRNSLSALGVIHASVAKYEELIAHGYYIETIGQSNRALLAIRDESFSSAPLQPKLSTAFSSFIFADNLI